MQALSNATSSVFVAGWEGVGKGRQNVDFGTMDLTFRPPAMDCDWTWILILLVLLIFMISRLGFEGSSSSGIAICTSGRSCMLAIAGILLGLFHNSLDSLGGS